MVVKVWVNDFLNNCDFQAGQKGLNHLQQPVSLKLLFKFFPVYNPIKMECQGIYTFDQRLRPRGLHERTSKIGELRVYKRFYKSYFTQDCQVSSVPYIHPRFGFG